MINLNGFWGALTRIGYDGPVALETFGKGLPALGFDEAARRTVLAVQNILHD